MKLLAGICVATMLLLTAGDSLVNAFSQSSTPTSQKGSAANAFRGTLGTPVGTVFIATATLIENEGGSKITLSIDNYRLRVTHVNKIVLPAPVEIDFEIHPLAEGSISIRSNTKERSQDVLQSNLIRTRKSLQFLAYETGEFQGTPNFPIELQGSGSANEIARHANVSFHFQGKLILLESSKQ